MRINGELVSLEEFIERMETIAQSDRDNIVVNLNFDSDMPMVKLSTVHVLLKRLNLTKVNYQSEFNKALPLVLPNEKIEQRIKTVPKTDIVDVRITEWSEVYFGDKEVPMKDVSRHVKKLLAENERLIVSIHFDKRTRYGDYVALLNQAKKGDARRIFINHPAD